MNRKWWMIISMAAVVAMGCSPSHMLRDAMDEATEQLSREITERVVSTYLDQIGPALIQSYSVGLMQVLFYQGGYYSPELAYEPGEYTIWHSEDSPYGETMERAFLKRRDDGWEWWRLEIFGDDPDGDEDFHLIMEALFEPDGDQRYIRELYVQYPEAEEVDHIEVDDDQAEQWVVRAERWSQEEMEQFLVGREEVTLAAGTFTADRYRAESADEEDYATEWWVTDRLVPGSVVKVNHGAIDGDESYTMELQSYGDGATRSVLGAF